MVVLGLFQELFTPQVSLSRLHHNYCQNGIFVHSQHAALVVVKLWWAIKFTTVAVPLDGGEPLLAQWASIDWERCLLGHDGEWHLNKYIEWAQPDTSRQMQTSLVCTLIKWLCQWERAWRNAPWLASDRWANREPPFPATPSDSHLFSSRSVWSLIVELGTACLLRWIRWSVMDMIQVWLVGNQTEFSSHCSGLLFPFENSCRYHWNFD